MLCPNTKQEFLRSALKYSFTMQASLQTFFQPFILRRLLCHFPCYFHDPDDYVQQHGILKEFSFSKNLYLSICSGAVDKKIILDFHEKFSKIDNNSL